MVTATDFFAPFLAELLAEGRHKMILNFLKGRFKGIPPPTVMALQKVFDLDKLEELASLAGDCPDLASFQAQLPGSE